MRRWIAFALVLSACGGAPEPEAPPVRNILFITADDLGLQLSSYGETRIETPHLDGLADQGVRFEVAYTAQASCSPSRSAMFTGRYVHATGQYGLTNTGYGLHEDLRDKTIPALLEPLGYRTGIIGKLHVNPDDAFPFDVRHTNYAKAREPEWVAERAKGFLEGSADSPFFLMVNFSDPHVFRRPPPRDDERYFPPQVAGYPADPIEPSEETLFSFQGVDTPEQRDRTGNYLNAVKRLDDGVGLLLAELEATGRAKETIVIFVSDHGPPFARGKTTTYEPGLRIPYIVRWPGVSRVGAVSGAMVSTVDVLPTAFDAIGVETPAGVHGRSLRPVLESDTETWRDYLVGEFHYHGSRPFYPRRAIRDERYQLIWNARAGEEKPSTGIDGDKALQVSRETRYDGTPVRTAFETFADPPRFELYDTHADPDGLKNLAGSREVAEVEQRLKEALAAWQEQTDDPFRNAEFIQSMAEAGAPATRKD